MREEEAKFERLLSMAKSWPRESTPELSHDQRIMFLAARDAVQSPHIGAAQRYLYCDPAMSGLLPPVFDAIVHSIHDSVLRQSRRA